MERDMRSKQDEGLGHEVEERRKGRKVFTSNKNL
jgi:hypothetical protein